MAAELSTKDVDDVRYALNVAVEGLLMVREALSALAYVIAVAAGEVDLGTDPPEEDEDVSEL